MLNKFRKQPKKEEKIEEEEVTFEKVEPIDETSHIQHLSPDLQERAYLDSLSDEEILARADEIRVRIARAEEAKHQQAIADERDKYYKAQADQEDRATKGRREQLWNELHTSSLPNVPSIMDVINRAFGDSISDEMKGVIALLIRQASNQEHQVNPLNTRLARELEDYAAELYARKK